MRRSSRVASPALWAAAAVMTLLSLLLAAPASADTVTPMRHCTYGDRYIDLDGERSAMARAPEGYLVAAFCVDSDGRRGGSELHMLSTPERATLVRHSDGRRLEGYSVAYVKTQPPEEPDEEEGEDDEDDEDDADDADDESNEGGRGGGAGGGSATPGAGKSDKAKPEDEAKETRAASPKSDEKEQHAERTPAAPESEPKPSRSASAEPTEEPDATSQMSALSDGEELRTTPIEEKSEIDDDVVRTLLVAGSIVLVGLIAGGIALLVRLPGQR